MSAWDQTRRIEQEGIRDIEKFLRSRTDLYKDVIRLFEGQGVREVNERCGDFACTTTEGKTIFIDVKVEMKYTGRLFLETWSNLGHNRGWLDKVSADFIIYYFRDRGVFYLIDFPKLRTWAFGDREKVGRLEHFKELKQGKYIQRNTTCGRVVPISVIRDEVGCRVFYRNPAAPGGFGDFAGDYRDGERQLPLF